jgi:hypothetical protein
MYTIEQAEEHFRENLRNLIGEWETEQNFYENLICSFDSEYLDENGNSPDYSDYAVETGDFRDIPYSSAQALEVYDEIPLILEGVTYYGGEGSVAHWVNQNYPAQTPLWDINDKKIIHLDKKFLQKYGMEMKEIRWLC